MVRLLRAMAHVQTVIVQTQRRAEKARRQVDVGAGWWKAGGPQVDVGAGWCRMVQVDLKNE